jgi:hypothetical protein
MACDTPRRAIARIEPEDRADVGPERLNELARRLMQNLGDVEPGANRA